MKTRITHLPNGRFIAEIEIEAPNFTAMTMFRREWMAIWRANDKFGLTKRGEEEFIDAQYEDEGACRYTAALYISVYYGDLPEFEPLDLYEKQTREVAER